MLMATTSQGRLGKFSSPCGTSNSAPFSKNAKQQRLKLLLAFQLSSVRVERTFFRLAPSQFPKGKNLLFSFLGDCRQTAQKARPARFGLPQIT
jgi:hypothetical protein